MDQRILAELKSLLTKVPGDLLRNVRTDKDPAFECGRMAGIVEGIGMAVEVVENALKEADDRE